MLYALHCRDARIRYAIMQVRTQIKCKCVTARVERFVILWPNCRAFGCHSSLWPEDTAFGKSYRCYLRLEVTMVRCSQMLQLLRGHREDISVGFGYNEL